MNIDDRMGGTEICIYLTNFGRIDFKEIGLEELVNANYSKNPIKFNDDNNQPGTVLGAITNKGNYAKIRFNDFKSSGTSGYTIDLTVHLYRDGNARPRTIDGRLVVREKPVQKPSQEPVPQETEEIF